MTRLGRRRRCTVAVVVAVRGALTAQVAGRITSARGRVAACAPAVLADDSEFLGPCHLLALLAAEVGLPSEVLATELPALAGTVPLAPTLPSTHSAGLDFSPGRGRVPGTATDRGPCAAGDLGPARHHPPRTGGPVADRLRELRPPGRGVFAIAATFDG